MTIEIIKNSDIQEAIKLLKPNKIAVAYIGKDWKEYIDESTLNELEIILSPTFGSNPEAIRSLVSKMGGWENIHFLKNLHAKFYMGKDAAIIGSFNLSKNGFEVDGLEEIGVKIKDEMQRKTLDAEFERLKRNAQEEYKTQDNKIDRLNKLQEDWGKVSQLEFITDRETQILDVSNFININIVWYDPKGTLIEEDIKQSGQEYFSIEKYVNYLNFVERDGNVLDKCPWVLCWPRSNNKMCLKNDKIYWLYISETRKNQLNSEPYTLLGVQFEAEVKNEPFKLTKKVLINIREILNTDEYKDLRTQNDEDHNGWSLASENTRNLKDRFLKQLKDSIKI